jgi:nucleoside-diphosphate-sugar epimerase
LGVSQLTDWCIIDSQWPVNFNWDLSTFEPHIQGVRRLLDFSYASTKKAQLLFLSTTGSVSHLSSAKPVPERPCEVLSPDLNGYNASKLISELVIEDEVRSTGEGNAAICRVGQVAGPVEKEGGEWNRQEWVPTVCSQFYAFKTKKKKDEQKLILRVSVDDCLFKAHWLPPI